MQATKNYPLFLQTWLPKGGVKLWAGAYTSKEAVLWAKKKINEDWNKKEPNETLLQEEGNVQGTPYRIFGLVLPGQKEKEGNNRSFKEIFAVLVDEKALFPADDEGKKILRQKLSLLHLQSQPVLLDFDQSEHLILKNEGRYDFLQEGSECLTLALPQKESAGPVPPVSLSTKGSLSASVVQKSQPSGNKGWVAFGILLVSVLFGLAGFIFYPEQKPQPDPKPPQEKAPIYHAVTLVVPPEKKVCLKKADNAATGQRVIVEGEMQFFFPQGYPLVLTAEQENFQGWKANDQIQEKGSFVIDNSLRIEPVWAKASATPTSTPQPVVTPAPTRREMTLTFSFAKIGVEKFCTVVVEADGKKMDIIDKTASIPEQSQVTLRTKSEYYDLDYGLVNYQKEEAKENACVFTMKGKNEITLYMKDNAEFEKWKKTQTFSSLQEASKLYQEKKDWAEKGPSEVKAKLKSLEDAHKQWEWIQSELSLKTLNEQIKDAKTLFPEGQTFPGNESEKKQWKTKKEALKQIEDWKNKAPWPYPVDDSWDDKKRAEHFQGCFQGKVKKWRDEYEILFPDTKDLAFDMKIIYYPTRVEAPVKFDSINLSRIYNTEQKLFIPVIQINQDTILNFDTTAYVLTVNFNNQKEEARKVKSVQCSLALATLEKIQKKIIEDFNKKTTPPSE